MKYLFRDIYVFVVAVVTVDSGAPIYGKEAILAGEDKPVIRHSCSCWRKAGAIQNTMETK